MIFSTIESLQNETLISRKSAKCFTSIISSEQCSKQYHFIIYEETEAKRLNDSVVRELTCEGNKNELSPCRLTKPKF